MTRKASRPARFEPGSAADIAGYTAIFPIKETARGRRPPDWCATRRRASFTDFSPVRCRLFHRRRHVVFESELHVVAFPVPKESEAKQGNIVRPRDGRREEN